MSVDQPINRDSLESSFNDIKFDGVAFELFFKKHFTPLCAYCQYKFGFDLDRAKEVVHDSFIKLWETQHTLTPHLSAKAFLNKIVTNNCLDVLKHEKVRQRHQQYVLHHAEESTFEQVDLKQLSADIEKAVAELPGQMRIIFELSRYEQLKYAEIARQLNISVKTVETQMSRALVRLRQKLSSYLAVGILLLLLNMIFKK